MLRPKAMLTYGRIVPAMPANSEHPRELTPPAALELLDLSPDAILVCRANGAICFWNRGAEAVYGWSRAEALGQNAQRLLGTDFPQPGAPSPGDPDDNHLWDGELITRTRDQRRLRVRARLRSYQAEDDSGRLVMHVHTPQLERRPDCASLVDSAPEAIIEATPDGVITRWNHAAERLYGCTAPEAVGRPLASVVPVEAEQASPGWLARLLAGERVQVMHTLDQPRDGQPVAISFSGFPVRDTLGNVTGLACIARDVSWYQRLYTAAQASELRARRLIESNIIGITVGDLHGRILEANDALLQIVGYTRADLHAGRLRWDAITPVEYMPLEEEAIAEALRTGAAGPWEKEYIRKDGSRVPVMLGVAVLDEQAGTTVGFILDLSEQKRGEAERNRLLEDMEHQSALLEAVFSATPTCLLVVSGAQSTIRSVNRAYRLLMPHAPGALIGRRIEDVWPDARGLGLLDIIERVAHTGVDAAPQRYTPRYADGSTRSFELRVIAIHWEDEPGALLALWDTTPLEDARAAAEAAVRARDDFISVASHELKTPITALMSMAQLARRRLDRGRELPREQVNDLVEQVSWQAMRLHLLAARLLDTSRIQAGTLALECEPADIVGLVRAVVRAAGQDRPIHLAAPAELMAEVDPVRLEQVVRNLLDNAIKYSPPGTGIEVEVASVEPDGLRLAVRDHGLGIPAEQRGRIFEKFYRADSVGEVSGMGLGLHISQQIVALHGGRIEVESPADGGTRFVVTLPRSRRRQR